MDTIPEFVNSIIVPIVVAIITAVSALISAAINIKNKENRVAAIATVVSIIIFIVMVVIIGGAFAWDMYALSHEKADILITNFDGIDSEQYRIAEFVRDQIRVPPHKLQDVVVAGDTVITESEGRNSARELGSQWNARIVIWGWYTIVEDFYLQLNIETLNRYSNDPEIDQSLKVIVQAKPDVLGTFAFQQQLGRDLSSTIYGLYCYSIRNWDCAIELLSDAINNRNHYVFIFDDPGILYHYRGGAYYFDDQYELAAHDLETAATFRENAQILYALGRAYEKQNNTVSAFTSYLKAADEYDDPGAYERLAIMASLLNDPEQAVTYYEKSIQVDHYQTFGPSDPEDENLIINAYLREGLRLQKAQDYETALTMFDRIIDMDYKYYDAYMLRGEIYMSLNQSEKAIADFDQYIENGNDESLKEKAKEYRNYLKYPEFTKFLDWYYKR